MVTAPTGYSTLSPYSRTVAARFSLHRGVIELYMDGKLIKRVNYTDRAHRKKIMKEWEILMRNMLTYHQFWIEIKH